MRYLGRLRSALGRTTRIALFLVAPIAFVLAGLWALSVTVAPWLLYWAPTNNMEPVCLQSTSINGEMTLRIPAAYFPYATDRVSGKLGFIILYFNYKDLQPWTTVPAGTEDYPPRTSKGDLTREDNLGDVTLVSWGGNSTELDPPSRLVESEDAVSPFPGWSRYLQNDDMGTSVDIAPPGDDVSFIACSNTLNNRPGICEAQEIYRGHWFNFKFRTAYLMQVEYFRERVHTLFNSFVSAYPCARE